MSVSTHIFLDLSVMRTSIVSWERGLRPKSAPELRADEFSHRGIISGLGRTSISDYLNLPVTPRR